LIFNKITQYRIWQFERKKRFAFTNQLYLKQEMSLKKTNGVGLKKEENITQARLSTCS